MPDHRYAAIQLTHDVLLVFIVLEPLGGWHAVRPRHRLHRGDLQADSEPADQYEEQCRLRSHEHVCFYIPHTCMHIARGKGGGGGGGGYDAYLNDKRVIKTRADTCMQMI